jgi:hypothetical protein
MGTWIVGIFAAPALGPMLSGFAVVAEGHVEVLKVILESHAK